MAVGMHLIALVPVVVFVERMRVQVGCALVVVVAQHYAAYVKVSFVVVPIAGDIAVLEIFVLMNLHFFVQV
jgi:hypothetical protein